MTIENVLRLHSPEPRWQDSPDADYSWTNRQDAVDYLADCGEILVKPHRFDVCAECARIEQHDEQRDPGDDRYGYLHSLWPCATALAADAP